MSTVWPTALAATTAATARPPAPLTAAQRRRWPSRSNTKEGDHESDSRATEVGAYRIRPDRIRCRRSGGEHLQPAWRLRLLGHQLDRLLAEHERSHRSIAVRLGSRRGQRPEDFRRLTACR